MDLLAQRTSIRAFVVLWICHHGHWPLLPNSRLEMLFWVSRQRAVFEMHWMQTWFNEYSVAHDDTVQRNAYFKKSRELGHVQALYTSRTVPV